MVTSKPFTTRYLKVDEGATISLETYADGSPALIIQGWSSEYEEDVYEVLTVNVGTGRLTVGDYSENEGIYDALVSHGVIEDTGKPVAIGYGFGYEVTIKEV